MKKSMIAYFYFIFVVGVSISHAQSIPDREMRERVTVLEQKIEEINQTLTTLKNATPSSSWTCMAYCTNNLNNAGKEVFGFGNSSYSAFEDMKEHCGQATLYVDKIIDRNDHYTDFVNVTFVNSCVKN